MFSTVKHNKKRQKIFSGRNKIIFLIKHISHGDIIVEPAVRVTPLRHVWGRVGWVIASLPGNDAI